MCLQRYHNAIVMKKFLFGFAILLVLSYFLTGSIKVSAQGTVQKSTPIEPVSTTAAETEYVLAYPGILPDNPLYFLKAVRDKLISFLISDFVKRAEFNLLASDKRINAALTLSTRHKSEIAISTLSKSNNYLDQAISAAASARNLGKEVDTVLHNLKNAIKKHKEVAGIIKGKIDKKFSSQLQVEIQRLDNFGIAVDKLLPQK